MFEDEVVGQQSDEVSQDKIVAAHGGESLADRDITEYEWAMQYVDSNKKVVLLIARNKGSCQLTKDKPFSYGRILCLDNEGYFLNHIFRTPLEHSIRRIRLSESGSS